MFATCIMEPATSYSQQSTIKLIFTQQIESIEETILSHIAHLFTCNAGSIDLQLFTFPEKNTAQNHQTQDHRGTSQE
jgi:abortive infection bacteriophage resistance protein